MPDIPDDLAILDNPKPLDPDTIEEIVAYLLMKYGSWKDYKHGRQRFPWEEAWSEVLVPLFSEYLLNPEASYPIYGSYDMEAVLVKIWCRLSGEGRPKVRPEWPHYDASEYVTSEGEKV